MLYHNEVMNNSFIMHKYITSIISLYSPIFFTINFKRFVEGYNCSSIMNSLLETICDLLWLHFFTFLMIQFNKFVSKLLYYQIVYNTGFRRTKDIIRICEEKSFCAHGGVIKHNQDRGVVELFYFGHSKTFLMIYFSIFLLVSSC